ncbi:MAG: hypothetical protein HY328_09970 [Chloroflexi bacterium]|nr:hypothetical protein [Chloroflexota bacterium]
MNPLRFVYHPEKPGRTSATDLAYLPITLSTRQGSVDRQGLLDTGSTVNVLPYTVGLALGFAWDQQRIPIVLAGSLSRVPAYGVIVSCLVASFPAVDLAFAWTQSADVPVILGQVNFFMEFDVCFF